MMVQKYAISSFTRTHQNFQKFAHEGLELEDSSPGLLYCAILLQTAHYSHSGSFHIQLGIDKCQESLCIQLQLMV